MKFGLLLHPERGVDAVFDEARCADQQGYDSIWLSDHLMEWRGQPGPDLPLDSFTLMTALGAVTSRTRLAWAMLNLSFRSRGVLAKMLATTTTSVLPMPARLFCSCGSFGRTRRPARRTIYTDPACRPWRNERGTA